MSSKGERQPPKILVIDDDKGIVEVVSTYLESCGFEVHGVTDSLESIEALKKFRPDILVLDLMMKALNGLQILEIIRRDRELEKLPVLILTAVNDRRGITAAAKLKVSAYLIKPFEPKKLIEKLEDILIAQGLPLPSADGIIGSTIDEEEPILDHYDKTVLLDLSSIEQLPAMPFIVNEVREAMQDETLDARRLARIIEKDHAIVSHVLRIANSVHYAQSREVKDVDQAVVVVGYKEVYNIVITLLVMEEFQFSDEQGGLNHADFWAHSFAVASLAKRLATPIGCDSPTDVFIGGIVHDLGKCLINLLVPGHYDRVINEVRQKNAYLRDVEQQKLGVTHTQVGGQAARSWEFPPLVRDSMRLHHIWHYGSISDRNEIRDLRSIFISDHIARAAGMGYDGESLIESIPSGLWQELKCENSKEVRRSVDEGIRDWARFLHPLGISSLQKYFDLDRYLTTHADERLPLHIIDMRKRPLSTPVYLLLNSKYKPVYHEDISSVTDDLRINRDIAGIIIQGLDPILAKSFYQLLKELPLPNIDKLPFCYVREYKGGTNDERTLSPKTALDYNLKIIQEPFTRESFFEEIENYVGEFRQKLF